MKKTALVAGAVLVLCTCAANDHVTWSARPVPGVVRAGEFTTVRITGEIGKGWYLYSITQPPGGPIATSVWLPEGQPFALHGTVSGSKPESGFDKVFGIVVEKHRGAVDFMVPIEVAPTATPGHGSIQLRVRFQACNDEICLSPRTAELSTPIEVSRALSPR